MKLFAFGVDPSFQDPDRHNTTALHAAALKNNTTMVEYLVQNGAKLQATDEAGETPVQAARKAGCAEATQLLERKEKA